MRTWSPVLIINKLDIKIMALIFTKQNEETYKSSQCLEIVLFYLALRLSNETI